MERSTDFFRFNRLWQSEHNASRQVIQRKGEVCDRVAVSAPDLLETLPRDYLELNAISCSSVKGFDR
jgi:hypothetical protein